MPHGFSDYLNPTDHGILPQRVDGLTKNVAAAMTAHTEPMANLTAQLKRVAAELPSHANTLTPKNNKALARMLGCVNPARCAGRFFLGLDIGPTRTI
jgi:hypothetical protein